jgi:hypothetical protein
MASNIGSLVYFIKMQKALTKLYGYRPVHLWPGILVYKAFGSSGSSSCYTFFKSRVAGEHSLTDLPGNRAMAMVKNHWLAGGQISQP